MLELVTLTARSGARDEVTETLERAILNGEEGSLLYLCATRPLLEETRRRLLLRPGAGGLGRLRMVLFQGLVNLILRDEMQGVTPLDPTLRDVLVGAALERLARESSLERLGPIASTPGLARAVGGLLAELKRAAVRPGLWRQAAEARQRPLERDLALVYESYQETLERLHAADSDDLGLWALEALARTKGAFFQGDALHGREPVRRVLVDGFQDFTPVQLAWLRVAVALTPQVTVYLEYDPDRPELYASAEATLRELEDLAGPGFVLRAAAPDRAGSGPAAPDRAGSGSASSGSASSDRPAELIRIAEELFRPAAGTPAEADAPPPAVDAPPPHEAASQAVERLEVQEGAGAAREIARLIRQALNADPGLRPSEIAVIYRDLGEDADLLALELGRAGVPCALPRRLPLSKVPGIQAALLLLRAAAEPGRLENLIAAAKTGYLRLSGQGAFESVALELGLSLSTEEWLARIDGRLASLRARQDQGDGESEVQDWRLARDIERYASARRTARDLLRRLGRWPAALSVESAAGLTGQMLQAVGLEEAVLSILQAAQPHEAGRPAGSAGAAPDVEEAEAAAIAARDLAALGSLADVAESLQAALAAAGESEMPPARWLDLLGQALGEVELSLAGSTGASRAGVQVLAAPAARRLQFRLVVVAGLVDGRFPKQFHPDWLLPDREREALRDLGIRLDTRRDLLTVERLHFFQAVTCATERLVLAYPAIKEDGAEQLPSFLVEEVVALFPAGRLAVSRPRPGRSWPEDWSRVANRPEFLRMAVYRAAHGEDAGARQVLAILGERGDLSPTLAPRTEAQEEREGVRWGAYDGVLADPVAADALAARYNDGYAFSASQLGRYGTCPFSFFAERVLRVLPLDEAGDDADPLEIGAIYHNVLYAFWDAYRGQTLDPARLAEYRAELGRVLEAQLDAFEAQGLRSHQGLWAVKRREVEARLMAFLDWETGLQAALSEPARPAYLELGFGTAGLDPASRPEPVRIEAGAETFLLKGKIDRIDVTPDGGYIVLDYKTSATPGIKEIREGRDLQVPLYLEAARTLLGKDFRPLGGGYQSIREQSRLHGLWRKEAAEQTGVSTGRGTLDAEEWSEVLGGSLAAAARYVVAVRNGEFPVRPNGDCPTHCEYSRICRLDLRRIGRKEAAARQGGDPSGPID